MIDERYKKTAESYAITSLDEAFNIKLRIDEGVYVCVCVSLTLELNNVSTNRFMQFIEDEGFVSRNLS